MSNKLYEIALNLLQDIGPVTARNLVSYCGGVKEVFEKSKSELLKIPGVGEARATLTNRDEALRCAERELKRIDQLGFKTYFYLDENYPNRLKMYDDSPILIYCNGSLNLNQGRLLAVVGSRKATEYGRSQCEKIIQELSDCGVCIVSGLAYGIDTVAHKAAVKNGMKTIGVLGNGFPKIYPSQNNSLAQQMVGKSGCLISQFALDALPDRENFPTRNKTVAYMTDATLVIESGASGGSMITANFAFHNHKELFAVPGRTTDAASAGCNKLIKANMAQLVTSGADIMKSMLWDAKLETKVIQPSLFLELDDNEKVIVDILKNNPDFHIDQISSSVEFNNSVLVSLLLQLELRGVIKQSVGKRYKLAR